VVTDTTGNPVRSVVELALGAAGLLLALVAAAWALSGGPSAGTGHGPAVLCGLAAASVAWLLVRIGRTYADRLSRAAWLFLSASLATCVIGVALETLTALPLVGALVVPANAGLAAAAFTLLPPSIVRVGDRDSHALDVGLLTTAGGMLLFQLVLRPAMHEANPALLVLMGLAGVALVAAMSSLFLRCPAAARPPSYWLLAAAYAVFVLGLGKQVLTATVSSSMSSVHGVFVALVAAAVLSEAAMPSAATVRRDFASLQARAGWWKAPVAAGAIVLVLGAWQGGPGGTILALGAAVLLTLTGMRLQRAGDETRRLRRERAILASDARYRTLVEHSADMIVVVDTTWTVTFASPSVSGSLGYRVAQVVGASFLDFVHSEDLAEAASRLRECLYGNRPVRGRWRMRRSDHSYIHSETVCANLTEEEALRGVVLTLRDVSERTQLEAELTHRAFHDPLTGLANRALFEDRVQHALARRRGDLVRLGVVFVDLDHFKRVNDEQGHTAGDALLRAAAQRLVGGLRAFDTAARLGGDELAVLIDDVSRPEEIMHVADRIIRAFSAPFVFDGREISTSASIGVALATPGQTADDLLRSADLAMYMAKKRGRGQAVLFEPQMFAAVASRREMQEDLRHALERSQLSLVYQPIHDLETRAMIGAEALLRWDHPDRGPISPTTFVPMAEESGLMVEIGHWVIRTACADAQVWRSRTPTPLPLRVWINLSSRQVPEAGLYDQLADAIRESGVAPEAIVLELTERVLLTHKDRAAQFMQRIKSLGIGLAIDDFGTGYSSLSHLQQLPIDILKIDRTFVDALESDRNASTLARTVVSLGELMSLQIVAEGIETEEQAERLLTLGCRAGQGFLFGAPMPASELPAFADKFGNLSIV
jgi:diguanylate cyclase (GGDEF)-like protein/PAS domain S-box-containing protein